MRLLAPFLLLLVLAFVPRPASAWNDPGHMLMAYVTYQQMKPETRARWTAILKAHPRYREDLLAGLPDGFQDPDLYAWMKAGTWPDLIRSRQHPLNLTHHHPNWHFINYPFVPPDADHEQLKPAMPTEDGTEIDNILKALKHNETVLKDEKAPAADRAVALCWMLHLIADLHQPLHATTLFSQRFPEGDRGGNEFLIRDQGEVQRLHLYWDLLFGTNDAPEAISVWFASLEDKPSCHQEAFASELKKTGFREWADESHALGVAIAYQKGALAGAVRKAYEADPAIAVPALPPAYEEMARSVACRQVSLAAFRLAQLLSE